MHRSSNQGADPEFAIPHYCQSAASQHITNTQVWHLRLTLHFLSDSGNLLDCASLAAMTALRHFRKPEVEVIGDEVIVVSMERLWRRCSRWSGRCRCRTERVAMTQRPPLRDKDQTHSPLPGPLQPINPQHSPDERAPVPLAIHHTPLCLTFAYYDNLPPILDPTHLEEVLAAGTMTITLNAQRELCVLSKAGGSALSADEIMDVVRVGVERVRTMVALMEEALAKDKASRVVEVV